MVRVLDVRDPGERSDAIARAVRSAKNGRLVVAPAETGYVVVADAFSRPGVAALQRLKGLSPTTSLGILVGSPAGVHAVAARLPAAAQDLIGAFWPGQLSLLVRLSDSLDWTVPTGRAAVRMPLHPVLLDLVTGIGPAVFSGVDAAQRDGVDVVLDLGERASGPGSTVVDVTGPTPVLLREGAVPAERVAQVVDLAGRT